MFISRSSLWANLDCSDDEKTRIYLERSKSSPINLMLCRRKTISSHDPVFQIVPHLTGRLKSLLIKSTPETIRAIAPHLSHPAPLLRRLDVSADQGITPNDHHPTLTPTLFNGDLSSLHTLNLHFIRTELPRGNMANLTSFALRCTEGVTVGRLLDFFESAPRLRQVYLHYTAPSADAQIQRGQLISLTCLKKMVISGFSPPSILLDHLVIPVGAELTTKGDLLDSLVGDHLPRSLNNLKNFPNFTTIRLFVNDVNPVIEFTGPNGQVKTILDNEDDHPISSNMALKCLTQLDTSTTERLEIDGGDSLSRDTFHQALLPMKGLRTLLLARSADLQIFMDALRPSTSPSEGVVCPGLGELILYDGQTSSIGSVIDMAAARASGGVQLGTIRIVDWGDLDVSELREHVLDVKRSYWDDGTNGDDVEEFEQHSYETECTYISAL